jgi:outer membrane protein OmpA-like peptidoglycan-associated protein
MFVLEVIVKNKNTMEPIPGATITLKTDEGLEFALTTDATGKVIYDANGAERYIIQEHGYEIDAFAENHFRAHGGFTTIGRKEGRRFYEEILVEEIIAEGGAYEMPQVLYLFDEWTLINTEQVNSNDSLNHLYNILIEHPNLVVELQAHTDCRGKASYNQKLSQKRAETCVNYLIGKGIPRDRLVPVGYGEAKPREGLGCSAIEKLATEQDKEAAHQRNRRTQFKILSFDYETK